MSLLDKFRKKSEPRKTVTTPTPAVGHGYRLLVKPLLTEKALHGASHGRYVFVVAKNANKPEIKKSIQKLYNVHVEMVKIINLPSKKRRYGKARGETSSHKKAIVVLKAGEKISGIEEAVG